MAVTKQQKTCARGHIFYKTSDCPTCPVCEKENKPGDDFLSLLSAPARRALENKGINTLEKLALYSEKEILAFHGMGPASLPVLTKVLKEKKLLFRDNDHIKTR